MLDSDDDIQQFLHYGYALPPRILPPAFVTAALTHTAAPEPDVVAAGVATLHNALHETWQRVASADHIIPISGGLDSRVILAWLVQNVDAARLRGITFGTPGTYDYEIGRLVARRAGIRAESIDLTQLRWRNDDLLALARNSTSAIPLFEAFLFDRVRQHFGTIGTCWSGFLGESLAGSHLPRTPSATWPAARARFARWKSHSVTLTRTGFDATARLPAEPHYNGITAPLYDDQLDLGVRQQHYIGPLLLRAAYSNATPFTHPDWVSFSLRAPVARRRNAALYHSIISAAFPALFTLPTKTNHGLPLHTTGWRARMKRDYVRSRASLKRRYPRWFRGALPTTNYIDFDEELRGATSLSAVVFDALQSLHDRRIIDWLDIRELWQTHQQRKHNYADALLSLASLEYYLQTS